MSGPVTSETDAPARKKTNWWLRLVPFAVILAVLVIAWMNGANKVLSLETLEAQRENLKAFVSDHRLLAVIGYILIYAIATVFMFPGSLWITIAGGFLFGLATGTFATVFGATLGATVLFFIARTSLGEPLRRRAGPFLKKIEAGFKEDALSYMFFLRFMPVFPFPVSNIAPALLGAKPREFVLTTAIGIFPAVLAYTWIGVGLGGIFDRGDELNLSGFFSQIAPPLAALGVVSLIPIVYKKFFRKPKNKAGVQLPPPSET